MLMVADPFDTLESAQEYVRLLASQIETERASVREAIAEGMHAGASRRVTALQIVDYKLTQLARDLSDARRTLNDLRMLRRLLLAQPEVMTALSADLPRAPGRSILPS